MERHLSLTATQYIPFMNLTNQDQNICSGITCNLIKYISRSLNFTFDLVTYSNKVSIQDENGSYNGVIGLIQKGQADLTGTQIILIEKPYFQKIVDFTQPITFEEPVVITRYEDSYSSADFNNITIFDRMSWLIFIYLIIHTLILLIILDKFFNSHENTLFEGISNAGFQVASTILGKDIPISNSLLQRVSTICLITSWLFSSLILSNIISGEITAMFSLKLPSKQINTLKELFHSNMTLVAFAGFMGFQNEKDKSIFNQIFTKVKQDKTMVSIDAMFQNKEWIVNTSLGKTAILLATIPLRMIILTHLKSFDPKIKFHFLDERYRQSLMVTLAMSMRLSQDFRNLINTRVLQYISTGIYEHQLKMTLLRADRLFDVKESIEQIYEQIALVQMFSLLEITSILLAICLVVFLVELVYFFRHHKCKKRWKSSRRKHSFFVQNYTSF